MDSEGGEEKAIKEHACHELTTTALAIASYTIDPSSTRNVCCQCFFFRSCFFCLGHQLYQDRRLQEVQDHLQPEECPGCSQRSVRGLPNSWRHLQCHQKFQLFPKDLWCSLAPGLYHFRVNCCLLLSQALVLGTLLCGADEMLHTKVGQAWWPGARIGNHWHLSSADGSGGDWVVPFHGGCADDGWLNCGSGLGYPLILPSRLRTGCTMWTMWWSCRLSNLVKLRPLREAP